MSQRPRKARPPEPVWLDADQQQAWRHVISLMVMLPAALESDLQRATGLTLFEYLVLANLSEADRSTLRMSELAQRANSSLSRLSHVVSRLTRSGWVRKKPSSTDGRVNEVTLTKAGAAKVVEAAPYHAASVQALVIAPLTPAQFARLGDTASLIADRIAEVNAAARSNDPA